MRKSKIVKIDEIEVTIKELRVRDIYELFSDGEDVTIMSRFDDVLDRCSDLTREQLMDMTPTDLQTLWDGFKEANSSFLDMAAQVGLDDLPGMLRNSLQEQFVSLSHQAMEQ